METHPTVNETLGDHILVAGVSTGSTKIIIRALTQAGYQITLGRTASDVWDRLEVGLAGERPPVALLLLDLTAPTLDGLQLLQGLRADPRLAPLPIVAVSSDQDQEAQSWLLQAGVNDYVLKPLRPAELLARIKAVLQWKRTERASQNRLERLVEAGRLLLSTLDLDEVLRRILEIMEAELDAEAGSVWLPAPDGSLVCYVAVKGGEERIVGMHIEPGQGIAGWVLQHQQATLVSDAQDDARFYRRSDEVSRFRTRSVAAVPMVVKGVGIGVLEAVNKRQGTFLPADLAWLEALVPLATAAIENARLFRHEQRTARYLHALNQAISTASVGLHLEQIPAAVVQALVQECGLTYAGLWLSPVPGAPLALQAVASTLSDMSTSPTEIPPYVEAVVNEERPIILNQIEDEPEKTYRWTQERGLVAFAGYPLLRGKQLHGVLALFSTEPLEAETLDMLEIFARELAVSLENTDLLRQVQRRNHELTTSHRIAEIAFQASSFEVAGQAIIQEISTALEFPFAAIELYNPARQTMVFKWAQGFRLPLEIPVSRSPSGLVAQTGRLFFQSNLQKTTHLHEALRRTRANTYIGLPMLVDQEVIGVLSLLHTESIQADERFLQWAAGLANYLGALIKRHQAEMALQESEQKFRTFTENTTAAILIHQGGKCLYVNAALATITGYFLEDLYALNFWELIHPEQREAIKARSLAQLRGQPGQSRYETKIITQSGQERWIDLTTDLISYEGRPAVLWTFQDITGHKQLEAALQESQMRYQAISELTSDYAYALRLEPDHFAIEWISGAFQRASRLADEKLLDLESLLELVYPEDRPAAIQQFRTTRSGQSTVAELRFVLPTGELRILRNHQSPVWDPRHQHVVQIYGAAQDITVHKQMEAEQLRFTAQLRAAADLVEQINGILDPQQLLPEVVTQLRTRFGFPQVALYLLDPETERLTLHVISVTGEPARDSAAGYPGAELPAVTETLMQAANRRELIVHQPEPAASVPWAEIAVPLITRDHLIGILAIQNVRGQAFSQVDLDTLSTLAGQIAIALENARLFEQVQKTASRLQTLSHRLVEVQENERRHIARELHDEIGQFLTGLKLTLELNERRPAEQAQQGQHEALTLVNDLIGRVRELSLDLRPSLLDDLGLLPALLWHFERYTAQTNVQVHFKQSGLERRFSPGLETAVYRIIQEALTNVARHAQTPEATVRIWCDERNLRLQVEDYGIGFEPHAILTHGGSNGLPGILERARLVGGELTVASAPGQGTQLTAVLPLSAG